MALTMGFKTTLCPAPVWCVYLRSLPLECHTDNGVRNNSLSCPSMACVQRSVTLADSHVPDNGVRINPLSCSYMVYLRSLSQERHTGRILTMTLTMGFETTLCPAPAWCVYLRSLPLECHTGRILTMTLTVGFETTLCPAPAWCVYLRSLPLECHTDNAGFETTLCPVTEWLRYMRLQSDTTADDGSDNGFQSNPLFFSYTACVSDVTASGVSHWQNTISKNATMSSKK